MAAGIVPNLRRPGGNITGVYVPEAAMAVKRLELMREIVPKAKRFLVLADRSAGNSLEIIRKAAAIEALIVLSSPVLFDQRKILAELALKHGQASAGFGGMADAGLLISYAAKFDKVFSRAGDIAASILGGAKPGDIPVEQSTEFELAVNLKAARALGITIPQSIAVRADRVIE